MTDWIIRCFLIAFAAWIAWSLLQGRYAFMIRIRDGRAHLNKGTVTQAFLVRVAEACKSEGVEHGWVGGVRRGPYTTLRFSRNFSPGLRQRLRNEWLDVG